MQQALCAPIQVDDTTVRAAGYVLVVRGNGNCRAVDAALIHKHMDTLSSRHVPHIHLPLTYQR